MANKILTIEVGSSITKICEMDYKVKKPVVYQCFHVATPPGVLDDGVVEQSEELIATIQSALMTKKIKTKQVVFTVSSNKIATRDVEIPLVKDNKLQMTLQSNAQDYFPVDLKQYELSYRKGEIKGEKGSQKIVLHAHATPGFLIQSYRNLAESCGLQIIGIDFVDNSIANIFNGELPAGAHMVIKIDDSSCLLTVFNNNDVVFQRYVMSGVDQAVNALQNIPEFNGKMPYAEAIRRFRSQSLLNGRFISFEERKQLNEGIQIMDMSVAPEKIKITAELEDMVTGISRIVDFYNAQNSENPIQDILLTGIGAEFVGMRELLTKELGRIVNVMTQYRNVTLDKKIANTSICAYSACVGAGFAPLQLISKKNKGDNSAPQKADLNKILLGGCLVGVVGAAALAFVGTNRMIESVNNYNIVVDQYNRLVETQRLVLEYNATVAAHDDFMQLGNYVYSQNINFVDILAELETVLPSGASLTSLSSSEEEMQLNFTTSTMEDCMNTIQQLRYLSYFQYVYLDNISQGYDADTQEEQYAFTITMTYVPYGEEKQGVSAMNDAELREYIKTVYDLEQEEAQLDEDGNPVTETQTEETAEDITQENGSQDQQSETLQETVGDIVE